MKKTNTFFKKTMIMFLTFLTLITLFVPKADVYAAEITHLKKTSITLTIGESYQQKLISKNNKTISYNSIKWKSKNSSIATISKKGKISAKKVGTVKMTAKYKNKTYHFSVKIKKAKFNFTKKTLYSGKKFTLKLYDAKNKKIDYSKISFKSSDTAIATVSKKGVVRALKKGTVKIIAKYKNKNYKSTIMVKSNISIKKSKITIKEGQSDKVLINTTDNLKNVTGEIVKGSSSIDFFWKDGWDGNKTYVTIKALSPGVSKLKISDQYNLSDYKYITVTIEKNYSNLEKMAACGINKAYNSAKFPATLHINSITYEKGILNGYGDTIDRMVLRCYSANSLGGYSELFVVVLRCEEDNNINGEYYPGYGYISTSTHSADPGTENNLFDNKKALKAYQKVYNTDRIIPYD